MTPLRLGARRTVDGRGDLGPFSLNPDNLTTHGVIVGMTGSGKTGLSIALLEEAAIDGIPAVIIDPKGDLTNLLLQFPDLKPRDFAEWLNPDDARARGLSVDDYAKQLSERWEASREEHEAALRAALVVPEGAVSVSVSIDGVLAPMEGTRVVEKRPSFNSTAYYIVAEGKPIPLIARFYSVYYKMDSLLDSFSSLSQRTSLYTEEGAAKRYASTQFNRSTKRASFESKAGTQTMTDELVIPANVQDGLATLYTLRGRTFRTGEKVSVPVTDDGTLYTVNFEVGAPEPITVPLGSVTAWNLRVTILDATNAAVGNNVRAWISTDARRLPVRLQADLPVGNFALALRSAQ